MATNNNVSGPNGKAVSVPEFAEIMNVENARIRELITAGMPVYQKGGRGKGHVLATRDCIDWFAAKEAGKNIQQKTGDEADQLKKIKIESAQLELDQKRGDLFHMDGWQSLVEETLVDARGRILRLADEFAEEFDANDQAGAMTRWLRRQLASKLNQVANELFDVPEKAKER